VAAARTLTKEGKAVGRVAPEPDRADARHQWASPGEVPRQPCDVLEVHLRAVARVLSGHGKQSDNEARLGSANGVNCWRKVVIPVVVRGENWRLPILFGVLVAGSMGTNRSVLGLISAKSLDKLQQGKKRPSL
jgi:hypothetical protein